MKILECDVCHVQVNNYGHWYNGVKPRTLYVLKTVDDYNDFDTYDDMIICHNCIQKLLNKNESEV